MKKALLFINRGALFVALALGLATSAVSAASHSCADRLTRAEAIFAEARQYTVNGSSAPTHPTEWLKYRDQVVEIEYSAPMPYYGSFGSLKLRVLPEERLEPLALEKAKHIVNYEYEVAFWQMRTRSGQIYYSELFTSRQYNVTDFGQAVAMANQLLWSNRLTLADLAQINLFHNHPSGTSAPLSTADRSAIFTLSERIKLMQCYPPVCGNHIEVGIYSVHPDTPGLLFYTDTSIR